MPRGMPTNVSAHCSSAECAVESIRDRGPGCCHAVSHAYGNSLAAWRLSATQFWAALQILRIFARTHSGAARPRVLVGYAGPDEHVLSFSRRNLTPPVTGRSIKPDHCCLDPIIIGTLVCARRWKIFDSGQPLRV